MELKILEGSENYTAQVIKLPVKVIVPGLDNLVQVTYQGNQCLVGKDSNEHISYLFFPAECCLSKDFLKYNNLYRHKELNLDQTQSGFFEDTGRVKAIKFKGVISTGFVIPLHSLTTFCKNDDYKELEIGDEFNCLDDEEICKKYKKKINGPKGFSNPKVKTIDKVIDNIFAPEHWDTAHLLKNVHKLHLDDYIACTLKLHGTSARYYNTKTKKALTWKDKVAKYFGVKVQTEEYNYVCASRRCLKSVGFEELPNKNHFYNGEDLWSRVGKEYFEGKLNHGEAVYCEIIGKTYSGEAIQHGYTYGLDKPKVYIYRISRINNQGIETDLSYHQMKRRAELLNVECCPEVYYGTLSNFIFLNTDNKSSEIFERDIEMYLSDIFYNRLLEKPSILDPNVVEEGFVLRIDKGLTVDMFKIKSKKFLEGESKNLDKEVKDIEADQL